MPWMSGVTSSTEPACRRPAFPACASRRDSARPATVSRRRYDMSVTLLDGPAPVNGCVLSILSNPRQGPVKRRAQRDVVRRDHQRVLGLRTRNERQGEVRAIPDGRRRITWPGRARGGREVWHWYLHLYWWRCRSPRKHLSTRLAGRSTDSTICYRGNRSETS
jgi:hypothetical protein